MASPSGGSHRHVDRRSVLAGLAAGTTAASGGCVRRIRSVVNRDEPDPLSLTVTTVPGDNDRPSMRIATRLADRLEAVGIDATVDPISNTELYRRVLLDGSFDIYVGTHPGGTDPDFLYGALHSVFAEEGGWQNPFGFTNLSFDDQLEEQRHLDGTNRRLAVSRLLRALANEQPFVPICTPDEVRLARSDRFRGWRPELLDERLGYLEIEAVADGGDERELDLVVTDARVTENLNPFAVGYRRNPDIFVDLLYDSLGTRDIEAFRPWLAESWEWDRAADDDGATATVTLREGLSWHDGEPVTADDVAFTYRFVDDTSMGDGSIAAPAPKYAGRTSIVEAIDVVDDRRLTIDATAAPDVAERAFTVPILPEHVWTERTGEADATGFDAPAGTTEAMVVNNVPPVGSGPFAFAEREERDLLVLERFDDHFTRHSSDLEAYATPAETLRIQIAASDESATEFVSAGDADLTVSMLDADSFGDLPESDAIERLERDSHAFYHVGFNVRNAPLSNPYVRRAVARLLDKGRIVDEVFDGHATPLATPVPSEWTPTALEWRGFDPEVPFFGTDGELDGRTARDAFESAGFRYDDEGRLVSRGN